MKLIFILFCRDKPRCILGFSRDWKFPKIYILVYPGETQHAKDYVQHKVLHRNPTMEKVSFQYIE